MTERHQIYKCEICGNIVEVTHEGAGTLVCCRKNMDLMVEKKEEEGNEKHLPSVSFEREKLVVKVGEVEHPMEEAHFIEWIEVIDGDNSQKVYLKPADSPKAEFTVSKNESLRIRSYCNLHGLWEKNI
ncbi:MAG: desulfoferrodoxin [Candidatus Dojkabacteria bacterium]|jgi:superoxide reductase